MKIIRSIELHPGSREEKLPDFMPDFPYIASRAELDRYRQPFVPWHWHRAVELFYMESGTLRYRTPNAEKIFPAGAGGMVNSNVLHMTETVSRSQENVQLLHIFDPELIAGAAGSAIDRSYVAPLTRDPGLELIALSPEEPAHRAVLAQIRQAFLLQESQPGYELRLRSALSEIWLSLFQLSPPGANCGGAGQNADKAKRMMTYLQAHYGEKITMADLAAAAYLSERECYRVFQTCLHTTPVRYLNGYRLQMACRMLADGQATMTEIAQACGLGSSSYFGRLFRQYTGQTPLEYRRKWQDRAKK